MNSSLSHQHQWRCHPLRTAAVTLAIASVITGCGVGKGTPFQQPVGIAVLPDQHIVVSDRAAKAIFRVDPDTGDRDVVASNTIGSGPDFATLADVYPESSASVLVADSGAGTVLRVDLVTGDRTIAAQSAKGEGAGFSTPYGIAMLDDGDLIVSDTASHGVYRVDSISQDQTLISGSGRGSGPAIVEPRSVVVEDEGHLLLANQGASGVLRITIESGNREQVSSSTGRGEGSEIIGPQGMALGYDGELAVTDNLQGEVLAVDRESGGRSLMVKVGQQTFSSPMGIAPEEHGGFVVVDDDLQAVIRIEPLSYSVTVVSDDNLATGRGGAAGIGGEPGSSGGSGSPGGGGPGGPGGGGPPTGGGDEGLGNNLAVPVVFSEGIGLGGLFVTNEDETLNYLNTGLRPTADENVTIAELPFDLFMDPPTCLDFDEDGEDDLCAYEQKTQSTWQAQWLDGSPEVVLATADWGDNLVKQTWTSRSVVRVEVVLTDLIRDTTGEPETPPDLQGYNMYLLRGSGATEVYGTDGTTAAMNESIYTSAARLRIEKLSGVDQDGDHGEPITEEPLYDSAVYEGYGVDGPGAFSAEVNVAGKVIYGFNWMLRTFAVPQGVSKEGWWRISFEIDPIVEYTIPGGEESHEKQDTVTAQSNIELINVHPLDTEAFVTAEGGESNILYEPVLDGPLATYIDIFITARKEPRQPGDAGAGGGSQP